MEKYYAATMISSFKSFLCAVELLFEGCKSSSSNGKGFVTSSRSYGAKDQANQILMGGRDVKVTTSSRDNFHLI